MLLLVELHEDITVNSRGSLDSVLTGTRDEEVDESNAHGGTSEERPDSGVTDERVKALELLSEVLRLGENNLKNVGGGGVGVSHLYL